MYSLSLHAGLYVCLYLDIKSAEGIRKGSRVESHLRVTISLGKLRIQIRYLSVTIYHNFCHQTIKPSTVPFSDRPNVHTQAESIATLPPFGLIEGHKWFFQISSQWAFQKNRFAFVYFGTIQLLPPCLWDLPFMSYHRLWALINLSQTQTPNGSVWPCIFKGSDKWKMREVGKLASVQRWFRTVPIDVCLVFKVIVVFSSTYFRFLFVKNK